jgi:hypothetical protein
MSAADYAPLFQQAGQQYNVDPDILRALTQQESNFNPNALNKETGASGLMQFIPATAKAYGIDPTDPAQSINAGAKMFAENLGKFGGNVDQAVAAHFAGPNQNQWGPKTKQYISDVSSKFAAIKGNAGFIPGQAPQMQSAATNDGSDPIIAALSGKPVAPPQLSQLSQQDDPIMAALSGKQGPVTAQNQPSAQGQTTPKQVFQQVMQNATAPPKSSDFNDVGRQVGLTARAGISGLAGIPNMLGDAANSLINMGTSGINKLAGTNIPALQMPSQATQDLMTKAGVPDPKNSMERMAQGVTSAMAGVSPSVALGKALATSVSPVASAVGNGLTQLPGMQVAGAAGSGAGGSIAQAMGMGPLGQIAGSLIGGAGGVLAPSAGLSAVRGAKTVTNNISGIAAPVVNPQKYVGQQLAEALGGDVSTVAENIRNSQQYVPGSLPTTAQAGANPMLVATEKSLANANPNFKIGLATRDAENNSARWDALNSIAQTPEALNLATAARTQAAQPLYEAAHAQTANVGDAFVNFARRPAVTQAMQEADTLARNEGVQLKWPTPTDRAISGQALDYTSRALGDMIGKAQRSGSNQETRALTDAQSYLKNWTEQQIPDVKQAGDVYRSLSMPVNTMEAVQQIAEQLGGRSLNAMGQAQITPQSYQSALAKALKQQKYGIDPEAQNTLNGVSSDLQRGTISNSLRSPGSDTAYNISANGWLAKQLYGSDFDGASALGKGAGALGALVTGHPFASAAILGGGKKLGQSVGGNLNAQLQELLLNPNLLLPHLDARALSKSNPQALAELLRSNVNQGTLGAASAMKPQP